MYTPCKGDDVIYLGTGSPNFLIKGWSYTIKGVLESTVDDGRLFFRFDDSLSWFPARDFDCVTLHRDKIINELLSDE